MDNWYTIDKIDANISVIGNQRKPSCPNVGIITADLIPLPYRFIYF